MQQLSSLWKFKVKVFTHIKTRTNSCPSVLQRDSTQTHYTLLTSQKRVFFHANITHLHITICNQLCEQTEWGGSLFKIVWEQVEWEKDKRWLVIRIVGQKENYPQNQFNVEWNKCIIFWFNKFCCQQVCGVLHNLK